MANTRLADFLGHVRTTLWVNQSQRLSDSQLLCAFTAQRDEGAFTAIVKKHGQMVLGVCRHVLGQEQDAEDAFQATFLVLARRAHTIRGGEALSNWLYGVAYRTALRAKRDAGRRRSRERLGAKMPGGDPAWEVAWREVQAVLEDEIHRLPAKYRRPFVLCFLEGKSRLEAARELQCKEGTISSRLDRARKRLQVRLDRRGVSLSATLGAAAISQTTAAAAMPLGLVARTAKGALLLSAKTPVSAKVGAMVLAGHVAGQALSKNVVFLAEGVMGAASLSKTLISALAVFLIITFGSTMALVAGRYSETTRETPIAQAPEAVNTRQRLKEDVPVTERLPAGAIARLGTSRFANIGRPFALSFTRDGQELVVGSWDGFLSVWDPGKKQVLKEWDSQAGSVRALAISPDGATIAEAGRVSGIRLWRRSDGRLITTIPRPPDQEDMTESLQFSPDGKYILAAGWVWGKNVTMYKQGRSVRVWELSTRKLVYVLERPRNAGFHVPSFAADGATLMVACYDRNQGSLLAKGYVLFVDLKTRKQTKRIELPDESVPRWFPANEYFALSSSGRWLVRTGKQQDYHARVWATNISRQRKMELLKCDRGQECDVPFAVAPDERCMAIALTNQELRVVELATGQIRSRFQSPDTGNASLTFSPNGRMLASGGVDRTVILWDLTGRLADGTMQPIKWSGRDLGHLWNDLESADGETTQRAIWSLVAGAEHSVSFLGEQLRAWRPADARRIAALIHDLGTESFQVRAKAGKELDDFHDAPEPLVRQKLTEPVTLEVRRRLEQVLQRIDQWWLKQQGSRAVEVLEHIASAQAQRVLKEIAASHASPRLADEAKAAVRRLALSEKS